MRALDDVLQFPTALSERVGLALAQSLDSDPRFATRLCKALEAAHPQTAQAELAVITTARSGPAKTKETPQVIHLHPGLHYCMTTQGQITLSGAALHDRDYVERLVQTLKSMK